MVDLRARVLDTVKMLKDIEGSALDGVITFAINQAIDDILIYCQVKEDEFPRILESTLVLMSLDILNEGDFLRTADEVADGRVKSIQEGDTTVSLVTEMEAYQIMAATPSFAKVYKRKLDAHRRIASS